MSNKTGKIDIPESVVRVLSKLEERGEKALIVGGCVRDSLLSKTPGDYDVATSATPEKMLEIFSDFRVIETGIKHGTVTVISGGVPVEITTFRRDGEYSDNRRPDSVSFVRSPKEDLSRRDFTVNAMAYSEEGGLIDLFGGRADLNAGLIRCVGEPKKRFEEDALRIMRALRFASTLNFKMEDETRRALFECRELLRDIAAERVAAELMKLICGAGAGRIVEEYIDILGVWLPELLPMKGFEQHNPYHVYDVLRHTAVAIDNVPPIPHVRLTALLHDSGKPYCYTQDEAGIGHFRGHPAKSVEIARAVSARLKLDNFTAGRVEVLVENHDARMPMEEKTVRQWMAKLTPEVFFELMYMKRADIIAQNPDKKDRVRDIDAFEQMARDVMARDACLALKDMKINGRDLIAVGFKPGPQIGETLNTLLGKIVEGELKNERETLLAQAEKML